MKNWLFIERSYFMAKKKFYAVKVGKIPGIYSTWNECEAQVKGVSGAKYKSFATLKEAEEFFHTEELLQLLKDHKEKKADNSRKIWTIYMFLVWHKQFFN